MDENVRQFAQRYRRWIDGYALPEDRAQAVWTRISNAFELSQGPPERAEIRQARYRRRGPLPAAARKRRSEK